MSYSANSVDIAQTYGISLTNMIDRIVWALEGITDNSGMIIRLAIIDFELIHGRDAVIGLYGFIRFIQLSKKSEEYKDRAIMEVFNHDLVNRKDRFMVPRSSGYEKFAHK